MSKYLALAAVAALICGALTTSLYQRASAEPAAKAKAPAKVLRHVVLFKFKDTSTPEDVKRFENAFRALPGKVDVICDFEWGTDVSVEDLSKGFTHCFFVSFRSEKDRATYLPHPAHKEFVSQIKPHLGDVLVVDYWAQK